MDETFSYVSTEVTATSVNIDGSSDKFYRYKTPQLTIVIVGQGKMVKTYLTNVDLVAEKLHIQPDYIAAYIGYATSSKFNYDARDKNNKSKCYIAGGKSVVELSIIIGKMIQKIILCEKCKLPELRYNIATKGVTVKCDGCGEKYLLTSINAKFKKYMILHKP